jgi:ribose/xylose/arabinose/galactoside ABC-type transport system permease subunit
VLWWFVLVLIAIRPEQTRGAFATVAQCGARAVSTSAGQITNYVIVAVLVGIAGILTRRGSGIDALRSRGLELEVIAAAVIGGRCWPAVRGIIGAAGRFMFGIGPAVLIGVRLFNAFIGTFIRSASSSTAGREIRT